MLRILAWISGNDVEQRWKLNVDGNPRSDAPIRREQKMPLPCP